MMPLDGVDSQGQKNTDVRKSVGLLLMSSMEVSRLEQRAYVKIAVLRGQNARECHAQLLQAVGDRALPYRTVARWVAAFESGREASKDKPRTGRPRTVRTDVSRAIIQQCLENDRRWSLQELATETGIDQATVHKILRHDLHMRKIAAKWVPHALTEQQKWTRYETCRVNLERYEREGDIMLNRIIAIDETWARAYEPELKRQSAEWRHHGSPRKHKVRQNPSPVKLMVILAYDIRGIILCHFVPHRQTVNAAYYHAYLQNNLRRAIRNKRPELLDNAIILHDNATSHTADIVKTRLQRWRWEVLDHPPYSPDLSPCDFDLIPKLKAPLRGRRFHTREDIANAVRREIARLDNGAADGIGRLPHRWQRTVDCLGDYFEGC